MAKDQTRWFLQQAAPQELEQVGQRLKTPFQHVRVPGGGDDPENEGQRVGKMRVKLMSCISSKRNQKSANTE